MSIRNRIKELRQVRAGDLIPDSRNWRRHEPAQRAALESMLESIGFAGAVIAREAPEGLILIDGHLRADLDPDQPIPCLITDVDEAEAGQLLATIDPLGAMATPDPALLAELIGTFQEVLPPPLLENLPMLYPTPAPEVIVTDAAMADSAGTALVWNKLNRGATLDALWIDGVRHLIPEHISEALREAPIEVLEEWYALGNS